MSEALNRDPRVGTPYCSDPNSVQWKELLDFDAELNKDAPFHIAGNMQRTIEGFLTTHRMTGYPLEIWNIRTRA